jgi:hypothetical protein
MSGEIQIKILEENFRDTSYCCRIFQKAIEENREETSNKVDIVPAEDRAEVAQN